MKEIKTDDIKALPEDTRNSTTLTDIIAITFIFITTNIRVIIFSIITLIILIGWYRESKYAGECTYTKAILMDTKAESYQWVPRHGGRVETRYDYVRTYEYADDSGEVYRFTINMPDSDSSKYLEVDVRYKDNNPDTLQFNIGQIQDRRNDVWVFYKR